MPTYEYACRKCEEHLEVVQSFKDDPLTKCPNCGGQLRKVFGSVGIVFKGSGFYKTDSRPTSSLKAERSESKSEKTETKSESTKTEPKTSDTKTSDTKKKSEKTAAAS